MASAALVLLPTASPSQRHSVSIKSTYSGPEQFPGSGSSLQILPPHISQECFHRYISSPLHLTGFFSGIVKYRSDFRTCERAINVYAGIRSSSSSSSGSRQSNGGPDVLPPFNPPATKSALFRHEQGLEAPSLHLEGRGDDNDDRLPPTEEPTDAQQSIKPESNGDESSFNNKIAATQQRKPLEVKGVDTSLPTMEDIVAAAAQQGVKLEAKFFGPTFQIVVSSLDGGKVFGKANGWITVWTKGKVLHLETVKLERGLSKKVGTIFGAGFFVGALTLRIGLDQGCRTAELMAVYDDEATHNKLVSYYSRIGFKAMYEVDEDWKYLVDRVAWGAVGTRMDADCEELLRKWSKLLKPKLQNQDVEPKAQNVQ